MRQISKPGISVLVLALAIRSVAVGVTTVTDLNPASHADAVKFGTTAEAISRGLRIGDPYAFTSNSIGFFQFINPLVTIDTYALWGTFLSPFWLIPGPSSLYARLGVAFVGAVGIYNAYLLAHSYHSHHAGVVAAIPMVFYPSFIAVHSTLLRDAMVLFGITTAVRFFLLRSERRPNVLSYLIAAGALYLSLLLRDDNIVVFVTAIAAALAVYIVTTRHLSTEFAIIGFLGSPLIFTFLLPVIRDGIQFLAYIRDVRTGGRTVYLQNIIPETIPELLAFSWIGAAYFLYTPFPWMIETVSDLLVGIEGLISIGFTIAAVWGVRYLGQKNMAVTVGLLAGLAAAVTLYGVGTVNYGTGMRHRQMFIWVIFLLGGIGISEKINLTQISR